MISPLASGDLDATAQIWHDGWHLSHVGLVPDDLVAFRDFSQFRARLAAFGDNLRVFKAKGVVKGMCVITQDKLDQIFVSKQAFGKGIASELLADGEARLKANGCTNAHLHCVQGNQRAIGFYEKHGWHAAKSDNVQVVAGAGTYDLECLIFQKILSSPF